MERAPTWWSSFAILPTQFCYASILLITGSLANPAGEGANYTVAAAGTYFIKVRHFDAAAGTGTYDIHIVNTSAVTSPLIISEFRVRGPSGANDEFVEVYNNSDTSTTVASQVGSGFAIAASDAVVRCTIPNGTVIPGRGHYPLHQQRGLFVGRLRHRRRHLYDRHSGQCRHRALQ